MNTNFKLIPLLMNNTARLLNGGYPDFSQHTLANTLGHLSWDVNAKYIHQMKSWYFWDGNIWLKDDKQENVRRIRDFLDELALELEIWGATRRTKTDDERKQLLSKVSSNIKLLRSKKFVTEISQLIQSNLKISATLDIFDKNLKLIGTPTGTVDLTTGQILSSSRLEYITKATQVTPIDSTPELWLKFLNKSFKRNKAIINFIQIMCGYCLTGLTDEQKLFFLYGSGSNGKSVFLNILYFILKDYAKHAPSSLLIDSKMNSHPTETAGLVGARCVIGSEIPKNQEWNESLIKDLTGGEAIRTRLMRQDFFEFKPQFTLLVAGNYKPTIDVQSYAIVRRMVLIPFEVRIEESKKDKNLTNKLKQEAPAILNWMIEGAVKYFDQGMKIPMVIKKATEEYIQDQDLIQEFIDKYLIEDKFNKVLISTVYQKLKEWGEDKNVNYSEKELRSLIKLKGHQIKRSNSKYYLSEFRLVN